MSLLPALLLLVVVVTVSSGPAPDYKDIVSNSEDDTWILVRARRSTKDVTKQKLTQEDRRQFLKAHNDFRASVQPEAANMKFMVRVRVETGDCCDRDCCNRDCCTLDCCD